MVGFQENSYINLWKSLNLNEAQFSNRNRHTGSQIENDEMCLQVSIEAQSSRENFGCDSQMFEIPFKGSGNLIHSKIPSQCAY